MNLLSAAKQRVLHLASGISGRHAILLPPEARDESKILSADAPYRVEWAPLVIRLLQPGPGRLTAKLLGYKEHFPTRELWTSEPRAYKGPCQITFALDAG